MKYKPEKKAEAISRIAEVGVARTSQELNISAQTLYKWQREQKTDDESASASAPAQPEINDEELRQLLLNEKSLQAAVQRLDSENASLREENTSLRLSIAQLKKAVVALMG